MQPRGKICAESEGGVNKICHFLYFLPEIHANTPKNIGKAMVAEQNREKAKRRENVYGRSSGTDRFCVLSGEE